MAERTYDIRINERQRAIILAAFKSADASASIDPDEFELLIGMFEALPNNPDNDLNDFVSDPFG